MQVHGIIDGESFHISLKKMFVSIVLWKEASWAKLKKEKHSSHQIQSLFIKMCTTLNIKFYEKNVKLQLHKLFFFKVWMRWAIQLIQCIFYSIMVKQNNGHWYCKLFTTQTVIVKCKGILIRKYPNAPWSSSLGLKHNWLISLICSLVSTMMTSTRATDVNKETLHLNVM